MSQPAAPGPLERDRARELARMQAQGQLAASSSSSAASSSASPSSPSSSATSRAELIKLTGLPGLVVDLTSDEDSEADAKKRRVSEPGPPPGPGADSATGPGPAASAAVATETSPRMALNKSLSSGSLEISSLSDDEVVLLEGDSELQAYGAYGFFCLAQARGRGQ
jgi:hypothetical protein